MAWEVAYENQIETWAFWQSPTGQAYAEGFLSDVLAKDREYAGLFVVQPEIETDKLLKADPIYVEEEMVKLWQIAAKDFKPEPLEASDLLCPAGFVYLPIPEYLYDVNGKTCSWRALAWEIMGFQRGEHKALGINVSIYTHRDDEDDFSDEWRKGRDFTDHALFKYPLTLLHAHNWAFGDSFEEVVKIEDASLTEEQVRNAKMGAWDQWRKIQALFRLMQQKIATPVEYAAPRPTRRRAQRQGFDPKTVTVIRLRRPKKPRESDEPVEVNWSHRWLVGGHWRNQWYPTLGVHRQVYVAPYIKGPEDKELRVREKRAFELIQ